MEAFNLVLYWFKSHLMSVAITAFKAEGGKL